MVKVLRGASLTRAQLYEQSVRVGAQNQQIEAAMQKAGSRFDVGVGAANAGLILGSFQLGDFML